MLIVDPAVEGRGNHNHVDTGADGRFETTKSRIVASCRSVHHSCHVVGIAAYPAEARKVLDGRGYAGLIHALGERGHFGSHRLRGPAVSPTQLTDRLVHPDHG